MGVCGVKVHPEMQRIFLAPIAMDGKNHKRRLGTAGSDRKNKITTCKHFAQNGYI